MITFDSGDIALVRFPFTDLRSTKQRPAVILNDIDYPRQYGDFVLIALTSQRLEDQFFLREWKAAGLLKPTWVKPHIATVSERLIAKVIGSATVSDHQAIRAAMEEIFAKRWLA